MMSVGTKHTTVVGCKRQSQNKNKFIEDLAFRDTIFLRLNVGN